MRRFLKFVIKLVLILAGGLLMAQAMFLSAYMSFNSGIVASFILGLVWLIYGLFFNKIQSLSQKGILNWIKRFIVSLMALLLGIMVVIAFYGQTDTATYREDAVIILGAGIDGETPRLPLLYRLEKGVEYYKKNPKTIIVVSGGRGAEENITEALAMERYLSGHGVPESHILKEEKSTSTYENFVFSKKILDQHFKGDYKILIITSDFHIFRAEQIAKIAGLSCTTLHAGIIWYSIPVIYMRESMAVVKLIIFRQ